MEKKFSWKEMKEKAKELGRKTLDLLNVKKNNYFHCVRDWASRVCDGLKKDEPKWKKYLKVAGKGLAWCVTSFTAGLLGYVAYFGTATLLAPIWGGIVYGLTIAYLCVVILAGFILDVAILLYCFNFFFCLIYKLVSLFC